MSLTDIVLRTIRTFHLLHADEKILIACSGGPDSLALLDILMKSAAELQITIGAAHINHGLRVDADADEEHVNTYCQKHSIAFYTEKIHYTTSTRSENMLRQKRYAALNTIADAHNYTRIATGHTADDQIETVIFRLMRGTGIHGLQGIPIQRENIIRPLLHCKRELIEEYCRTYNLKPVIDSTNTDTHYTRNKIRHVIIPSLIKHIPMIQNNLLALSAHAAETVDFLNTQLKNSNILTDDGISTCLPIDTYSALPNALQKHCIHHWLNAFHAPITAAGINSIHTALRSVHAHNSIIFNNDYLTITIENAAIQLYSPNMRTAYNNLTYTYPLQKSIIIHPAGIRLQVSRMQKNTIQQFQHNTLYFNTAAIRHTLFVRNRRPGDRIHPLGMNGTKKLKSIFTDNKVPQHIKNKVPVILDGNSIIGLLWPNPPGPQLQIIAETVKLQETTHEVLTITASVL